MNDSDPTAIHVMQMILGSKPARLQVTLLKSLLLHHFGRDKPNPEPIHLHILTDKETGFIVNGVLSSWQINSLRYTIYSAEPYKVIPSFSMLITGMNCPINNANEWFKL